MLEFNDKVGCGATKIRTAVVLKYLVFEILISHLNCTMPSYMKDIVGKYYSI